jgi:hypothetical protein
MTGLDSFQHDTNARNDPKLKVIENKYTLAYTWFFKIVEYMAENGGRLERSNIFFYSVLSTEINCPPDVLERFLDDCLSKDVGLFYIEDKAGGIEFLRSKRLDIEADRRTKESKVMSFVATAKTKREYPTDSFEYKTSVRFFELFAKPSGAKEPNFHIWANVFRMIREIDGRSEEYIIKTMEAINGHEGANGFSWREVIRSPETFRKRMNEGKIGPTLKGKISNAVRASGKYDNIEGVKHG